MQPGERSLRAQGLPSERTPRLRAGRRLVNAVRMPREVVVAGNYSHDTLLGAEERSELGGSAAYVSAILRAAGVDFAVVANVGDDFRYADLVPPARVIPGARTTSFVDDYRTGERIATLHAAAPAFAGAARGRAGLRARLRPFGPRAAPRAPSRSARCADARRLPQGGPRRGGGARPGPPAALLHDPADRRPARMHRPLRDRGAPRPRLR